MKLLFSLIIVAFSLATAFAQTPVFQLPKGAVLIERRTIPATVHRDRQLVLWMTKAEKHPNGYAGDETYTCPDYSRGSYYSGPLRVSLMDSSSGAIINTLKIIEDEEDSFDVPYAIRKGYYYDVPAATKDGVEVKPTIMALRDYNGDGAALEFALFDAMACMGLGTSLVGYSPRQDKVIQYPITVEIIKDAKHSTWNTLWADYLFNKKPTRPGYWKFEIDYSGRGGTIDKWEVHYVPAEERFTATLVITPGEQ